MKGVQTGGDGYTTIISISDWISFSPSGYRIQRKLYVMMWKNLVQHCTPLWCSASLQLSLSTVYRLSLTLICPAWIIRRSERAPHFTHNNLISLPLAQGQNRGETRRVLKAGGLITWWWGVCVCVCVCVCIRGPSYVEVPRYLSFLVIKFREAFKAY